MDCNSSRMLWPVAVVPCVPLQSSYMAGLNRKLNRGQQGIVNAREQHPWTRRWSRTCDPPTPPVCAPGQLEAQALRQWSPCRLCGGSIGTTASGLCCWTRAEPGEPCNWFAS